MKKILSGAALVALLGVFPGVAHADHWKALAIYGNGWGFGEGSSEDEARSNAIFQCKLGNPDCSWGTSVQSGWTLIGIQCANASYTAGSEYGLAQAAHNAAQKAVNAGDYNCHFVVKK
jgi:hypothetical protein